MCYMRYDYFDFILKGFLLYIMLPLSIYGQEWKDEPKLLGPRGEFGNVIVDDKLFIMGGIFNSKSGPASVEVYDFKTEKWTIVSTMPTHKNHFTIGYSVYGEEIWVVGGKLNGGGKKAVKQVDIYNYRTNNWRKGPDLPEALWGAPTVVIKDKIHIMGGSTADNSTPISLHYVLDLTDEPAGWKRAADLPVPRIHLAAVPYNGKIWVIGGEVNHNHSGDTKTVQVYDPTTDSWELDYPELPEARSHSEWATFVHGGKIYSVSGVDSGKKPRGQETIYTYSCTSGQWTQIFDLPIKLVSPGAKVYNDRLYVYGGGENDWFDGDLRSMYSYPLSGATTDCGNVVPTPPKEPEPTPKSLKVRIQHLFLEGLYDVGQQKMTSLLKEKNLLPLQQPFESSIWQYDGAEKLDNIPDDMIDWVLITLRDSTGETYVSQACILNQEGTLLSVDGKEDIELDPINNISLTSDETNYILSIHHKSHLSVGFEVRAEGIIDPLNGSIAIGNEQMKIIQEVPMMYSGDYDGNGIINNLDANLWKQNSAAVNRYLAIDADGNGIVNNLDFNQWSVNKSKIGALK